ncbi:MAG: PAS domain S-box protein [Bacteroidota bacterium]|nr:PAS domain S-box protein [Bacteroidota bacterium]
MKQNKTMDIKKNIGGLMFRKLFIITAGISIIEGLLCIEGQRLNLYDQQFGTALGIILVISTFLLITGKFANFLKNADKKRLEEELRLVSINNELSANEIIYRNLIENSGVVMYTTSINGCITFTSSKAFELTGYPMKEIIGMHFTKLIDADWLGEVKSKYKNQVKNSIGETVMEFCIRTKYGDLKWVEQSAILLIENNEPAGFQCIVKEISERKEMEEVLRKYEVELVHNQERLQSILDNATSLIYIKDLDGKYVLTNKQFKESLTVNDSVIGKTDFDFTSFEKAQHYKETDEEVLRTCKPVQLEEIIDMPDGAHNVLIVKFPLLNAQNEIYGISGIATDITDRVRYEKELIKAKKIAEDAKKLQEQFLANMSHEIRTPMNGIQGMTDLILETQLSDEQKDFAKTIKRSSDNLLVIINDILDFSKIQAGKLTIEKIDFYFNEVLENIKAIFRHRINEKGLTFAINIDANVPPKLNGDPYRLNQILVNLIGNAIKFTHQGSVGINISVQQLTPAEIVLNFSISDSGIGIEADKINEIFESFTQASVETSRKYGGTGLGLAITKQLLELQRGSIHVESKINCGTTFHFSIPYNFSATNNPAFFAGKDLKNYRTLLQGKKFLVAEDNEVNQKVIRHVLQKAGGTVHIVNNGLEAVNLLKENAAYDLIIMDLQMPEMDGYAATKYIRTTMNISIPIIAMTASALKGEKAKCLEIGMNEYLSKPFDSAFLYKRINELLKETSTVKTTAMTNETTQNESLFDLSILHEMDDNEYVIDIVSLYLNGTPHELQELKKACAAKQFDTVHHLAHKLKSSTALLKANALLKIIIKIEEFSKAQIGEGLSVLAEQAIDAYQKLAGPLNEVVKNIHVSSR